MHYGPGNAYDTFPPDLENLMGNRKHLTAGDIEQILDVYQCIQIPVSLTESQCVVHFLMFFLLFCLCQMIYIV